MHARLQEDTASATIDDSSLDFFEASPTSMWLEDYSKLRRLFDTWRAQGITELGSYLRADPARVAQCSACIEVLRVNPSTLQLYAAQSFAELSARLGDILRDDTFDSFVHELEQLWSGQTQFGSKTVNYALDGRRMDIQLKGVILRGHERSWYRVLVSIDDVTELEHTRREARDNARYAQSLFQYAPVSLWVEDFSQIKRLLEDLRERGITDFRTFTDVHPEFVERCMAEIKVLDINQYTLGMFKANSKADLLSNLAHVFREEMIPSFREQLIDLWDGRLFQQREVLNHTLEGAVLNIHMQFSVFSGHEENWDLVLLALTDITARKKAENYLEYLGKHDVLTKLKNRSFYVDEFNRIERRGIVPTSVLIIDLNHLKETNDTLGHISGDALLQRTGEILQQAVDAPYQAARVGGDEFIVLLPGVEEAGAEALIHNIRELIDLNNQYYSGPPLRLSMGYATARTPGTLDAALREADRNMYEEKRHYYEHIARDRRHYD